MKYLTDRKQIAEAMNFGKYPVLRIDMETPKAGWNSAYDGDYVRVVSQRHNGLDIRAQLEVFIEDGKVKYEIMPEPVFLDGSFGYSSVMEMLRFAQAPMIHGGETVVVIEDYPKIRTCKVHMMKVSDRVADFTYPTCHLEEIEED